ncbi:MAG: hypothetical protein ACRDVL_05760 [Acidimicrobiia bacterium]
MEFDARVRRLVHHGIRVADQQHSGKLLFLVEVSAVGAKVGDASLGRIQGTTPPAS